MKMSRPSAWLKFAVLGLATLCFASAQPPLTRSSPATSSPARDEQKDESSKSQAATDETPKDKDKAKEKEKEKENANGKAKGTEQAKEKSKDRELYGPEKPVVTTHELKLSGRVLSYTATVGKLPIRDKTTHETEASLFFLAYTVKSDRPRPLMFSFNGGPGSSSVWLHLGALGPKIVKMPADATMPKPPYRVADNLQTWLDFTDLVFIDPVGTGYSRAARPELTKKFHGLKGDLDSVGEFIRLYLSRYERWDSPLFLVGESYGTTRAAGLAGKLIEEGIAFSGIVLVSSVLNFQTVEFARGNDLPYILFLPTYTATAWFHKKLPNDLQAELIPALRASESFALGEYSRALAQGSDLTGEERNRIRGQLSRFTGLSETFLEQTDLRIEIHEFCKELLRSDRRTVGRLDSRFLGVDERAAGETPGFDPSMAAIRPPYTAAMNQYVRTQLKYKSDLTYEILSSVGPWDWGNAGRQGFPDTSVGLRSAFAKNPHMRLFVASGYYDLATPYFATEYTLDHMSLDPSQRTRAEVKYYEAGHMMYIHDRSLSDLKKNVQAFVESAGRP